MKPAVREWIAKAEADFHIAQREYRARQRPNFDAACFFSQQCIEKYLKARILEAGFEVPRTHDLPVLLDVVLPVEPLWESARPRLETLTSYAVVFRYPGDSATRALAKTAIANARWVRSMIRSAFRLR